ncbi:MAG: ATPase, T2SS/T4P/T4SS family, partial [Candidatus Omnitrophota bacterium]
RQDPNVILIGEIRDRETADISFRASLTGHLVFSTLHTNNAAATITRLLDIGIEPFLISSSIILIVAQRLVKVLCQGCREEYIPSEAQKARFAGYISKLGVQKFYRGKGCAKCGYTGFSGRMPVFEILEFDEKIRGLAAEGASEDAIFKQARQSGMITLAEAGIEKVAAGVTTLEEVAKVCDVVEEIPLPVEDKGKRDKPKLLIADDEADIRMILEKRLVSAGYDVIKAVNGTEAVEAAIREKPDLIITDVMMPEMDGFEVVKALRSNLETAVIPVIMLTAKKDKESELGGIEAGADDYITKPFDKDKLLARIKMLLRRKQ